MVTVSDVSLGTGAGLEELEELVEPIELVVGLTEETVGSALVVGSVLDDELGSLGSLVSLGSGTGLGCEVGCVVGCVVGSVGGSVLAEVTDGTEGGDGSELAVALF